MSRSGRPRVLSRATLEEAASELFLEKGYLHTSINDIAARAGISRATFFNYFDQKSDLLFVSVDEALDRLEYAYERGLSLPAALHSVSALIDRSALPLVVSQAEAMGAHGDALNAGPGRLLRLKSIIGQWISDPVWQWAVAGALTEGAMAWAAAPPGANELPESLNEALRLLDRPVSDYVDVEVD